MTMRNGNVAGVGGDEPQHVEVGVVGNLVPAALPQATAFTDTDAKAPKRPRDMTPQELQAEEPDLVDYLFKAADTVRVTPVEIERIKVPKRDEKGKVVRDDAGEIVLVPWHIRVRGMHQEEYTEAQRRSRHTWQFDEKNKRVWQPDQVEYLSWIVYMGTVPEDRSAPGGWDDPRMLAHFKCGNGVEVIDQFLLAGEKTRIAAVISQLSGLNMPEELAENLFGAEAGS